MKEKISPGKKKFELSDVAACSSISNEDSISMDGYPSRTSFYKTGDRSQQYENICLVLSLPSNVECTQPYVTTDGMSLIIPFKWKKLMGDISSGYLQDFLTGTNIVQEQEKALLEGFKISDNEFMMGEGENKIGQFSINLPFAVVDTADSNV